jgi:hypothetical protein
MSVMQTIKAYAPVIIGAVILIQMVISCQSGPAIDPDKEQVRANTEELFTRLKVNDYAVLYENEFPYNYEEAELDRYLLHPYLRWGRLDTLMAMQVDSVTVLGDSAYAHLQLEYMLADSSLSITALDFIWRKSEGRWIHPTLSSLERQQEYEEEIRIYWDAVREMQKNQGQDSASPADTAG